MKSQTLQLAAHILVLWALSASGAIRYVNVNGATPTPPYTNWPTAATTIQDAVDSAVAGDQILVGSGIYQTGGRAVAEGTTNRVAVNKAVTIQSLNGVAVTVIRGFQVPNTTNGDSAIRCVYLTSGAALVGFTLTNGATRSSGDYRDQNGGGVWCESTSAVVSNCTLTGNSAYGSGGGACNGTLNDCTLSGNTASFTSGGGGGASDSTLSNCTLTGNSVEFSGGGVAGGTLNNCTLSGNSATVGGGAIGATLNNCTLAANSVSYLGGGGAYDSMLNNCVLTGNSAYFWGGGASASSLTNCTLTGNSAADGGGGTDGGIMNNCIVYYNSAPLGANYSGSVLSYSCTTPLPTNGIANFTSAPLFMDYAGGNLRLQSNSPCINAGYNPSAPAGPDLDGNPRIVGGTVDVGAYEFQSLQSHIFNTRYVNVNSAGPAAPYTNWTTAATTIQDAVDAAVNGDQILVTNGVYQTGGRAVFGVMTNRMAVDKPVTVRSVNGAAVTVVQGTQVPSTVNGDGAVRCVYLANGATLVGFTLTNGATRSSGDQDGERRGGGLWCESTSAIVSNCVLTANSASSGGGGASRGTLIDCSFVGNSATNDFSAGGGALESTLLNCTLTGNSAFVGGGTAGGTLNNCTLTDNSGSFGGGGAAGGTLNNCVLTGNSTYFNGGGGAGGSELNNCIVYYNSAPNGPNKDNYSDCVLSYSCTTPFPTSGIANFTNAPLFVDYASGNLRLQSNSPCINSGSNASAPAGPDLDGNPRILGGTVDVGAYEFQSPQSLISYAWLQQYGLPTDGSADQTDTDGDGMNNWQEWRAGTDPKSALSALRLLSPASGATGVIVSWQSVTGRNYFLERGTDLGAQPNFLPLATDIIGQPGTTTFTDTNAVGAGPFFYRVGVQE